MSEKDLTVAEAQAALNKAKEEVRKAEARERVREREGKLSKRSGDFPPGFKFYWYHRHDPLKSYYRLGFVPAGASQELMSWDMGDSSDSRLRARELAWREFDHAVAICRESGLLAGEVPE